MKQFAVKLFQYQIKAHSKKTQVEFSQNFSFNHIIIKRL